MKNLFLLLLFLIFSNQINAQTQPKKKLNKDFILDSIQQMHTILSEKKFILNFINKDIVFNDINGKILKLSDFKDKPICIRFWSIKCEPCRDLAIREKREGFSDNSIYLYINEYDKVGDILTFVKENKEHFPTKNLYHISSFDNPNLVHERKERMSIFTHIDYPAYYWITKDGWFIHHPDYMIGYLEEKLKEDFIIIEKLLILKRLIF